MATANQSGLRLGSLLLDGEVIVTSGPWSDGSRADRLGVEPGSGVGAIVTKTVTLDARDGSSGPVLVEHAGQTINRVGLRGPGVSDALDWTVAPLARCGVPVLLSVFAETIAELEAIFDTLDRADWAGVAGVEINASCPNVDTHGIEWATALVRVARSRCGTRPVVVKLPPDPWRIAELAWAAQLAGADAIAATNTLPAALPSQDGSLYDGGLSGAALLPVALRCVRAARGACSLPIIGIGGIGGATQVRLHLAAGATFVGVGSAHLDAPDAAARIAHELAHPQHDVRHPTPRQRLAPDDTAWERIEDRLAGSSMGLCVGIDPDIDAHPPDVRSLAAVEAHVMHVLDAVLPFAAAVKPNVSMFERHGSDGWAMLERIVDALPAEIPVIVDGKRGDVPSTARHSAAMCFDRLAADGATVNPLLGADALEPFVERAGRLVFLLAATSNPGADEIQARSVDGEPLAYFLARMAVRLDAEGPARVGIVAGATRPERLAAIRELAPDAWLLVPGIGAQGGDPDATLAAISGHGSGRTLVNASRSILHARDARGELSIDAALDAAQLLASQLTERNIVHA